jgi:hypothetical protein
MNIVVVLWLLLFLSACKNVLCYLICLFVSLLYSFRTSTYLETFMAMEQVIANHPAIVKYGYRVKSTVNILQGVCNKHYKES